LNQVESASLVQRQIDNHHVGLHSIELLEGAAHVPGFAADTKIGLDLQQGAQSLPDDRVVVDDQNLVDAGGSGDGRASVFVNWQAGVLENCVGQSTILDAAVGNAIGGGGAVYGFAVSMGRRPAKQICRRRIGFSP